MGKRKTSARDTRRKKSARKASTSHVTKKKSSEEELLRFFQTLPSDPRVVLGIGDDAAIFDGDETQWVVTTDSLVEGSHFKPEWITPELLGRKSAISNLSDVAAMGAWPRYALVSLILPPDWFSPKAIKKLYDGLLHEFSPFGTTIVGGNISRGKQLSLTLTVIGDVKRPLARDTAQVGDLVFVTGQLGEASMEVEQLLNNKRKTMSHVPQCRVAFAYELAKERLVTSAIDISDGLTLDASRLAERSGVSLHIQLPDLPMAPSVLPPLSTSTTAFETYVLAGGEVYELLFTAPERSTGAIFDLAERSNSPVSIIGTVRRGEGIFGIDAMGRKQKLAPSGWSH